MNASSAARSNCSSMPDAIIVRRHLAHAQGTPRRGFRCRCGSRSQRRASIRRRSNAFADRSSRNCGARASVLLTSQAATWWATAFPNHPYGRPVNGTLESVPRITIDDLRSYTRHVLARDASQDRYRRRYRCCHRPEHCSTVPSARYPQVPSSPETASACAGTWPAHGHPARCSAGRCCASAAPGSGTQRSGFHGRLYRQSYPRRRLVLLAALSGGAREARARLRRVRQPDLAQSCCLAVRYAPRRAPTPPAKASRSSSRRSGDWREEGPSEEELEQDEDLSERLVRTRPRQLEPDCRPASADRKPTSLGIDYIERRSS